MGPKMKHFGCILEPFSQVDGNSDFDYLSAAIFNTSGLQGIPKSFFFCIFPETAPRTIPEDTSTGTFDDFCRFWRFVGAPRLLFGAHFLRFFIICFDVKKVIDFGELLGISWVQVHFYIKRCCFVYQNCFLASLRKTMQNHMEITTENHF